VAICGRDADALERARTALERIGATVLAVECDVTDRAAVRGLISAVSRRLGPVDVLINNAGVIEVGPAETMAVEDYEEAMATNFWGMLYPTLEVIPAMLAQGSGRIVNITSIGGKISVPHLLPYNCAKFAAVGFSDGLHAELAPRGVRVTTVVPGLMRTGSHLHARFAGQPLKEFAWFSILAGTPPLSMDAERAARRIVDGIRRGRARVILTPAAQAATRLSGAMPTLTVRLLAATDRLLPSPHGQPGTAVEGTEVEQKMDRGLLRRLSALNSAAARRFNQIQPDPPARSGR
jgi:short-subunit dehydrogenase